MKMKKDRLGFLKAVSYEEMPASAIRQELGLSSAEDALVTRIENGGRNSFSLPKQGSVAVRPGDLISGAPQITKGATAPPTRGVPSPDRRLSDEVTALHRAGIPQARLVHSTRGWEVRIAGFTLPRGSRAEVLILLPHSYPAVGPIGFYVANRGSAGGLDSEHLFGDRAYYGAPVIDGYSWFCGLVPGWTPGRHTLVSYIAVVTRFLTEKMQ